MSFLITDSDTPLMPETLPALKLTHFSGEPARGCVYSYLRCYLCGGSLSFSLTVFDGEPRDTARIGLALSLDDDARRYLFLSCSPHRGDSLQLYENDAPAQPLILAPLQHTSGGDEQGLYWAVQGELPAELFLRVFGRIPKSGCLMPGNVYLYDEAEAAFGCAFPADGERTVPCRSGFGSFLAVPY